MNLLSTGCEQWPEVASTAGKGSKCRKPIPPSCGESGFLSLRGSRFEDAPLSPAASPRRVR